MRDGSEVPYYLRPNKHIDRELFVELLGRVVPIWGAENYCYFSMGGRHLIDQRMVYRRLGISHLFSVDNDEKVVARQKFNRPVASASCELMEATDLASKFSEILDDIDGANKAIVWLDYSSPKNRRGQILDFVNVAREMTPGEIARLTLNAQVTTLGSEEEWKKQQSQDSTDQTLGEYRAERLRKKLDSMVPANVKEVDQSSLPLVLLECVRNYLEKAGIFELKNKIKPVLATCYDDGHMMLTITIICVDDAGALPVGLEKWQYLCPDWEKALIIQSPDLSTKEQVALDVALGKKDDELILAEASFLPSDASSKGQSLAAIQSYRNFRRFYPAFRNTENS